MRVGFAQEVPLFSFPFFLDLLVDTYFIADIWINFKTAFWKPNGTLEKSSARRWLAVRVTCCVA